MNIYLLSNFLYNLFLPYQIVEQGRLTAESSSSHDREVLAMLDAEVKRLKEQLIEKDKALTASRAELSRQQTTIEAQDNRLKDVLTRNEEQYVTIEKLQGDLSHCTEESRKKISDLGKLVAEMQQEIADLKAELEECNVDLYDTRERLSAAEAENTKLFHDLELKAAELALHVNDVNANADEIDELRKALQHTKKELTERTQACLEAEHEVKVLEHDKDQILSDLKTSQERRDGLEADLGAAMNRIRDLEEALRKLKEDKDGEVVSTSSLQMKLSSLQGQFDVQVSKQIKSKNEDFQYLQA